MHTRTHGPACNIHGSPDRQQWLGGHHYHHHTAVSFLTTQPAKLMNRVLHSASRQPRSMVHSRTRQKEIALFTQHGGTDREASRRLLRQHAQNAENKKKRPNIRVLTLTLIRAS